MKATILQENFSQALFLTSRFVSSRAQLPVLNNLLLEAKEGTLRVSATNLELGVLHKTPAKIEEDGAICVPAKILTELVAGLSKERVEISRQDAGLKVTSGKHRALVNAMAASEFPKFPEVGREASMFFDKGLLTEISARIAFAASQDEGRPALSGLLVSVTPGKEMRFVATDGFRLSLKKIKIEGGKDGPAEILIPARAFLEAGKITAEKNNEENEGARLVLLSGGNQAAFVWEDTILYSRLIEGKFPAYEKIIPAGFTTKVVLDREEFFKSIKLAAIFARESANIIKIKVGQNQLKISANAPQTGEDESEIEAKTLGEENTIAFNSRYLLEYLNSVSSEQIEMELSGPLSPGVFKQAGDESLIHLIMPVRLQD